MKKLVILLAVASVLLTACSMDSYEAKNWYYSGYKDGYEQGKNHEEYFSWMSCDTDSKYFERSYEAGYGKGYDDGRTKQKKKTKDELIKNWW